MAAAMAGLTAAGIADGAAATASMIALQKAASMFQLMLAIQEMLNNIIKKGSNAAANAIG